MFPCAMLARKRKSANSSAARASARWRCWQVSRVTPLRALDDSFQSETITTAEKVDTDTFIHSQHGSRRGRIEKDAARTSHPAVLDQYQTIDPIAFFTEHVVLAVDEVTCGASQLVREWLAERLAGNEPEIFDQTIDTVCAISVVENVAEGFELAQET